MRSEEIKDKVNDFIELSKMQCGHLGFYALESELADIEYTVEVTDEFYRLTLTRRKKKLRIVQHISNAGLNQVRNVDAALNTVIKDSFNLLFNKDEHWNELYLS